ncbi:dienelactone hydrolase family protein [Hazenella sp. IB182357]|uniref:Dienelactone hydrolase family protein n=1 Tax=Polycladospora coralii TaxID=2771432 RepID=A0A926RV79_9BACL|nr:dienelactone hydrolase family protein [Polycladospora coralii]MBD1373903.1 dienelactone hydrolase family protein [Polycladospora coralii]
MSAKAMVILMHEIYGVNDHMHHMQKQLIADGYDTLCLDLYDGKQFELHEGHRAYSYFKQEVGFTKASDHLIHKMKELRGQYPFLFVIGFSVGATSAWLSCTASELCDGVVCYYGSRIRDYTDQTPKCPTLLIFAEHEVHFDVGALMGVLSHHPQTVLKRFYGAHGFSNPYAKAYNEEAAKQAYTQSLWFLEQVKNKKENKLLRECN